VLRVTVDLPDDALGGVPMEAVASASQALSAALDASTVMGGTPYVLEVSSPGVDRPLTEHRHWARARGRLVRAALSDGRQVTDRLSEVDGDGVVIGSSRIAWADLRTGRIEIEFARPGDTTDDAADLDGSDLDDSDLDDSDLDDDEGPTDEEQEV